jgi:hypothetical protein
MASRLCCASLSAHSTVLETTTAPSWLRKEMPVQALAGSTMPAQAMQAAVARAKMLLVFMLPFPVVKSLRS